MIYMFASLIVFFFFAFFHVVLHRILARGNILTMRTALIFLPGLIVDIYIIYRLSAVFGTLKPTYIFMNIPLSAIIFYLLLASLLSIFYAHPAMNFISPSTMILRILEKKKMNHKELMSFFSDEMLIQNRLNELLKSKLIRFEGERYKVSDKGKQLILLRERYRKIFGWERKT